MNDKPMQLNARIVMGVGGFRSSVLYRRTERVIDSPMAVLGDNLSKPLSDGIRLQPPIIEREHLERVLDELRAALEAER